MKGNTTIATTISCPRTRSHTGARARLFVRGAAVLATLALAAPGAGAAPRPDEGPGPLPWRVPGPAGFTVDASSFPDSTGLTLDVYLRIPAERLRKMSEDTTRTRRLVIAAELRSGYGGKRQQAQQILQVSHRDTVGEYGEVVLLRFPARPGPQRLKIKVQDPNPPRRLPMIGQSSQDMAQVSGDFELPAAQQNRRLSDPEFIWSESARTAGPFVRFGRSLIPNPERLYGRLDPTLHVAFVATGGVASRAWHWRGRVLDERRDPVATAESTTTAGPMLEAELRLDVSKLPAGGYDLELHAWQDGDVKPLERIARFSVAWNPDTWRLGAGDVQDLAHFLMTAEEEERFARLHPGEQERWIESFWQRRDPSPDNGLNEAKVAFMQRIDQANRRFGRAGFERGMFSDMGRVFIRYGEPSDVQKQVMPSGDETLQQIVQELTYTQNRDIGSVHSQGLGGDMRPYEVWIYEGEIPLPIEVDPTSARNTRHQKLVFLFVDDHGLGDYRLRYSNE